MTMKLRTVVIAFGVLLLVTTSVVTVQAATSTYLTSGNSDAKIWGSANIVRNKVVDIKKPKKIEKYINPYSYGGGLVGPHRDAGEGYFKVGTGSSKTNKTSVKLNRYKTTVKAVTGSTTSKKVNISVKLNGFSEKSDTVSVK